MRRRTLRLRGRYKFPELDKGTQKGHLSPSCYFEFFRLWSIKIPQTFPVTDSFMWYHFRFFLCRKAMGKNKHKSSGRPKEKSVFKVAGSRVTKGKAKPVTTNLKRVSECLYHLCPVEQINYIIRQIVLNCLI